MRDWFNRLLDQTDPTVSAHTVAVAVILAFYLTMTAAHAVWPVLVWDPVGFSVGALPIVAAIIVGNVAGPKPPQ